MLTLTPADVRAAFRGDKAAMRALLEEIVPVIETRATRVMLRLPARARAAGHEHADLVQESFARLFAGNGRALLQWNPERGMSLRNWVGLIVERTLLTLLHSTGSSLQLAERDDLHQLSWEDPVALLESRSALVRLALHLAAVLPARRLALFARLCVRREDISDVARSTGLSEKALYAARMRMEKLVKGFAEDAA